MVEEVAYDGINVCQLQGWILFDNSFRRHPFTKGCNDGVKRYARVSNTHNAVRVINQGNMFGAYRERHSNSPQFKR
jgi:hypothetical protein